MPFCRGSSWPRDWTWVFCSAGNREGRCVCLWLIHVIVWQKPTQLCKTVILQLKKKESTAKKSSFQNAAYEIYSNILLWIRTMRFYSFQISFWNAKIGFLMKKPIDLWIKARCHEWSIIFHDGILNEMLFMK